jgi:meso-butanediol dehydrogenase/(S,S)-butanediol dehydrogenase/diacetyl reductase
MASHPEELGMRRFRERSALVTGGSHGIGLAIVERLLTEGAKVTILAAPEDEADLDALIARRAREGYSLAGMTGDVSDEAVVEAFVTLAVERHGPIDALFNNAGGGGYWLPFEETDVALLDRTLRFNIRGNFLCTQAALKHMEPGGAVVNTASTASFMGEELQAGYNAAKAGLAGLTRTLAVDLAPKGIRVNAVAPGWVATRKTVDYLANRQEWAKHRTHIPLDRPAEPSEIAAVSVFLATDDASYVTGSVVLVDGGMTAGFRFRGWEAVVPEN